MMSVYAKVKQKPNDPCGCKSGLKYKWCHGDPLKIAVLERIVQEIMAGMIMEEKFKHKLITETQYKAFLKRRDPNAIRPPVTQSDVQDALKDAGLKKCAGFLCNTPIPDNQTFCQKCKRKSNN